MIRQTPRYLPAKGKTMYKDWNDFYDERARQEELYPNQFPSKATTRGMEAQNRYNERQALAQTSRELLASPKRSSSGGSAVYEVSGSELTDTKPSAGMILMQLIAGVVCFVGLFALVDQRGPDLASEMTLGLSLVAGLIGFCLLPMLIDFVIGLIACCVELTWFAIKLAFGLAVVGMIFFVISIFIEGEQADANGVDAAGETPTTFTSHDAW
ncbi:MAG: hypothetical protein ACPGYV_14085 [Phycisphaeraceae bacterium]